MSKPGYIKSTHEPARNPYRSHKLCQYRKANGITAWTDANLVRAHIHRLYAKGLTRAMIARAAGLTPGGIANIENGAYERTNNRVAAAILAVTHHPHPRQELVPAVGLIRRVHALNAIGWPTELLATRLDVIPQSLTRTVRGKSATYERWKQIADLYEELSATPGPSIKGRQIAARNGYAAPLDWEYLDIDDPDVTPEPATTTPRHIREQEKRERDNQILTRLAAGRPYDVIARELGITPDHVRRIDRNNPTPQKEAA